MESMQKIRISVRNLVEFILRSGDIDDRHGSFGDKDAMQEGSRIHRKIQGRMGGNYSAEVSLSTDFEDKEDNFILTVEGRADGIFFEDGERAGRDYIRIFKTQGRKLSEEKRFYIDEIKGIYKDVNTLEEPVPLHLAQAKCYACIYAQQQALEEIGVQITYCNMESEEVRRFRFGYSREELSEWFQKLVSSYMKWARLEIRWRGTRKDSIQNLAFPFSWRTGQKDVAAAVYRTMVQEKKLFIQAPTGTGKTLSTLYPAVKAVGEGKADRIFYGTAKTVTRTVAEEGMEILRNKGLRMKSVTLTAKEKICFLEEKKCNPDDCPYAKGHYDRVNDAVFELVSTEEFYDRKRLEAQAEKWKVCPFEMGLDVALWSDTIICDYNYIFDPRAKLKRFFADGVRGDYLFLIDEAHNLVDRAREMYSASLYKEEFLELKKAIKPYSMKINRALNRCNTWLLEQKRECSGVNVLDGIGTFPVYLTNLCGLMEEFLEDSGNGELNEKVLELYFECSRFLETCDQLDDNYLIYTQICEDGRFMIRLFCVDVSENLQKCLDKGKSTIYFSATFLPIGYYRSLLSTVSDDYAIYAHSVFDPGKRKVLIGTDTSSRYTRRNTSEYRKMAEYVLQLIQAKRGNYMIFFSSYRMLEDVAEQFRQLCQEKEENIDLLQQVSNMKDIEREAFLHEFEEVHEHGLAGFCVMGGIFGEGIDLKNDRLIGAVVAGTGLPQVCSERELLKQFYDQRGEDGFFYAYLCPGMNKVLQSAGRVIRTEEDTGVILLLDERFSNSSYRSMFPEEWNNLEYCSVQTLSEKVKQFWEMQEE